jgi:hypothetical protein
VTGDNSVSDEITNGLIAANRLYRLYQNDWSGLEVDYIHKFGEETYKY